MTKTKKKFAIAVAAVAAFALLVPTVSYAANQITGKDIENGSVRSVDIKNDNLRSGDIEDGTLRLRDMTDWVKAEIREGGAPGADGEDGTDGVSGYSVHNREVLNVAGEDHVVTVPCPDGSVALGGGFASDRPDAVVMNTSAPVYADGVATGWTVTYDSTVRTGSKAWVTCAVVSTN